jgi:signal transduction histidine kinase
MAGAEHIRLQQFEVAAIAAPAGLLCQQLLLTSTGECGDLTQLLLQNPALLLRALEAQHQLQDEHRRAPLASRLCNPDAEWLHTLLADMSLQLVLKGSRHHHLFHQLHWQEARYLAVLARLLSQRCGAMAEPGAQSVEYCALLLDCGKLVLEQKHGAAWVGLYLEISQQQRLLDAERQTLGCDHIAAGVALLQGLQLEQDCIDALRYQAQPLNAVLDATPLVRITWMARKLVELTPETLAPAQQAAQRLFGLSPFDVDRLLQQAQDDCNRELRSWDAAQNLPQQRGISDLEQQHFEQTVREQLQALQWQLLSESALLGLEHVAVDTPDALRRVLARALQQAAVDPRFLVLATVSGQQRLQVLTSNKLDQLAPELGLQLEPGRSVLADRVLAGELGLLTTSHEGLSVVDRQVLELLGNGLLCEPVQTRAGYSVLLLAASPVYSQRRLLRAFVKRKLGALQQPALPASAASNVEGLLYRQRVREAIHEANNPLAIIKNYLQILQMKSGDGGAAKEIRIIHHEIDRVAAILADLREDGSGVTPAREVDLNALLRSMHPVFAQAFAAQQTLDIQLDLADDPATVQAQPDAIKQILTNLVMNAAEAMLQGGKITLATRRNVYQNETRYLQLSVADTGPGMPSAQLASLFVAGNTTKGGDHRGSGLAIVKRLVDGMAGQISCQSDNKGTVISILLPQRP